MNEEALDTCGCCEGIQPITPESEKNLPGLASLAYRVGTHATFVETMRAALPGHPPLDLLTTRADDDPTIALLDAWATVLDVLGFYQERIANEGYLRTATERRSILDLARSIGYELRPGVAASTYLAFTLETAKGAPAKAIVGIGTKAQSIPAQDEKPQLFETIEEIEARGAWNELKPQTRELILPKINDTMIYLLGAETGLQAGDALLVVGDERLKFNGSENWDFRRVKRIEKFPSPDPADSYTAITLDRGFGTETPHIVEPAKKNVKVYALRQRASLFGYNALPWKALPVGMRVGEKSPQPPHDILPGEFAGREKTWAEAKFAVGTTQINLDAVYPKITKDSWIVLAIPTYEEVYRVTEAVEENKKDFLLAGKTTQLTIDGEHIHFFSPRTAMVFGQSEPLDFAARPITTPVQGDSVVLNASVSGLTPGRKLGITGIDEATGKAVSEIVTLKNAVPAGDLTELNFIGNLAHVYKRDTVKINANVARATHGETKNEVLGAGDGSQSFQEFVLKQTPLTYVSASTPSGAMSTLEVRVNGVLWDEVPTLYQLPTGERAYITRLADDGKVTAKFGDGINGARLPTGQENVVAKYRVGNGLPGLVAAGQISLLLTRPLGVKEVVNPIAPTGAADPETLAGARQNAPLTVLTLDRIVSLRDFEDFARAFAGIGKAQATSLWNGEQRLVHLTVAGADGGSVPATSELFGKLNTAIDAARHPDQAVRVASFQALQFDVAAKVFVDRHFFAADVLAEVNNALVAAFSFAAREFGQAVTESELAATMQQIEGVVAIDLDYLYFSSQLAASNPRLPAHTAHWSLQTIAPAELLTVNPHGIALTAKTP